MKQLVKVWDLPTRLFHWALVLLFAGMWFSGKQGGDWMEWHLRGGVALAALLLFRLIWGVLGSETARFGNFLKGPQALRRYLKGELSESEQPGHNPMGGWMVALMLTALTAQVTTGLFSADVNAYLYDGPLASAISSELAEQMNSWHRLNFNLLLALAGVHLAAIVLYRLVKKQNLVKAMLTGYKSIEGEAPNLYFAPAVIALVTLIVAAGAVYFVLTRF
ncbi:cytochrome b/b6 domain-containing protein [Craterilacuibacter sp.]|uniref:cytochrome b/b6 domain-containing protein n=1 Tax=Craterilacuibacter sp. TaxID=2870909 RepID=UPI003F3AA87E